MDRFIINKNQQTNGDHEVHNATTGCSHMPSLENQIDLGLHNTCQQAVAEAKLRWPNNRIDGCYYCANACHTS
ncbi:hypothetical protein [Marinospirillum minutulum]|uniref:hypothetical protein n=1 Tax=Marinospirillum minutulum TaxID=64974 RepID=UPI000416417A|nr:hypothetical protein [Marinospirillum minutulum]